MEVLDITSREMWEKTGTNAHMYAHRSSLSNFLFFLRDTKAAVAAMC